MTLIARQKANNFKTNHYVQHTFNRRIPRSTLPTRSRRELISTVFQRRGAMPSTMWPFRPRPLLVFISFPHPAASSARSRGGKYLRRTNMRKHPGNDRRFSPLSLARRVLRGTRFASSLWSFNVCSADSRAIRPLWRPSFGPSALIQYYIAVVDGANFVNATNQLRRHNFKQFSSLHHHSA